jgi:hypothetical protein
MTGSFDIGVVPAYIEAISAIVVFTKRNPIQQTKNIQMKPAVPPFTRPMVATLWMTVPISRLMSVILERFCLYNVPQGKFPRRHEYHGKAKYRQESKVSLQQICSVTLQNRKSVLASTNSQFLYLPHTVHIRAISCVPALVVSITV